MSELVPEGYPYLKAYLRIIELESEVVKEVEQCMEVECNLEAFDVVLVFHVESRDPVRLFPIKLVVL